MCAGIPIFATLPQRVEPKNLAQALVGQLLSRPVAIRLRFLPAPRLAPTAPEPLRVNKPRRTAIERLYQRYLDTENTAAFVKAVSERYLLSTLERLASGGGHTLRRAAVMAVGFLGDFSHNAVLGRALNDHDRGVRLLADSGIRQLWRRDGNLRQQRQMAHLCRLNQNDQYLEAICDATA